MSIRIGKSIIIVSVLLTILLYLGCRTNDYYKIDKFQLGMTESEVIDVFDGNVYFRTIIFEDDTPELKYIEIKRDIWSRFVICAENGEVCSISGRSSNSGKDAELWKKTKEEFKKNYGEPDEIVKEDNSDDEVLIWGDVELNDFMINESIDGRAIMLRYVLGDISFLISNEGRGASVL